MTDDQKTQIKGFCDTKSDKRSCWRFCKKNPDSCVSTTPNTISDSTDISLDSTNTDTTDISSDSTVIDTTSTSSDGVVVDSSSISVDDTTTQQSKWIVIAEALKSIFGNSDASSSSTNSEFVSDGIVVNEGTATKTESVVIEPEKIEVPVETSKSSSESLKDENIDLLGDDDLLSENEGSDSENEKASDTSLLDKTASFFGSVFNGIKNNPFSKGEEDVIQ